MGLPDRYVTYNQLTLILQFLFLPLVPLLPYRLPVPGYAGDIMADPPNGQPSERDIDQIISTCGCKGSP